MYHNIKKYKMNLHEYQGKEILNSFGVKIQRGIVADNHKKAVEAAKQLAAETGTGWWVVKAQIHAGGRGKGGGVKLAKNLGEVESISERYYRNDVENTSNSSRRKKGKSSFDC